MDSIINIILPICQILTPFIIGGILVYYLNRRNNKDKIKSLLIDAYIEYLNLYKNFHIYELKDYKISVYNSILKHRDLHLGNDGIEFFKKTINDLENKYPQKWFDENANISFSTYKFCFLIGSKKYFSKYQPLENLCMQYVVNKEVRDAQISVIIDEILKDEALKKKIHSHHSKDALKGIDDIIYTQLTENEFGTFNAYNAAISFAIDKY